MSEEKNKGERYFNFPVQLLKGFMANKDEVLDHIWNYSLYVQSLKYDWDNEEDLIASAKRFFSVKGCDNLTIYERGQELRDSIPMNSPMVGIKTEIFFDYLNNEKDDFQKLCLLGYLAIRSILQNKAYCKITNNYLWARMNGDLKAFRGKTFEKFRKEIAPSLRTYANDYRTRKIKDELHDNWNLKTYAFYTRGFYVSFKTDLDDLVLQVEKQKKITKEKQRKEEIKNARLKALKKLNINSNNNSKNYKS